jgi:dienelactone hydrolase
MRERLRHGWRAAAFTLELVAGDRARWLTGRATPVTVTQHTVAHHGRVVSYECYAVARRGGSRSPAIVVTHGFTHEGAADPRLQALCRRLARAGFVVVALEFDDMRQPASAPAIRQTSGRRRRPRRSSGHDVYRWA